MAGPTMEETPASKSRLNSKMALALGLLAHTMDEKRIEFIDDGETRPRGGYGEIARAILHAVENCVHPDASSSSSSTTHTCRKVAIKIIFISDDVSADLMEKRFAREVYIWSQLRHDNILEILGHHFLKQKKRAWLVCPWVCGGNALAYLKAQKPELVDKFHLAADAARGLVYLHTRTPPICHGDIKAANVLINNGRAQLCDFGLASMVEDGGTSSLATGSDFKGSIPWCSPELLNGAARSPQNDIWAWGWFLWELMTGKRPFHEIARPGTIVLRIVSLKLPDVSSFPAPSGMLMQRSWKLLEERLVLSDAINILRQVDDALQTQPPTVSDFEPTVQEVVAITNSLPPSLPTNRLPQAFPDDSNELVAISLPTVPKPPRPVHLPPRSRHDVWQAIKEAIGCCCCTSHSETWDESCPGQIVPMAPLTSSDKSDRQTGRTTALADTPHDIQVPRPVPSPAEQRATVAPSSVGIRGVVLEEDGGQTNPVDSVAFWSDINSHPLSIQDIGGIESVSGAPNLFCGVRRTTGKKVTIRVPRDMKLAVEMIRRGDAEDIRTEFEIVTAFRLHVSHLHTLVARHINPTDGHFAIDGFLGVVTPWCENGNLWEYIRCNPDANLWDLLHQVLDGLLFLHAQDPPIIHGSLKPENVLVDSEGRIALSEVGEIPFLEGLLVGITTCGQVHDIRWMPPEVLRGSGWSMQSDIYAVGLLGQSIISGSIPFADVEAPAAMVRAISFGENPFNVDFGSLLAWERIWDLLGRCANIEFTQRPTIQTVRAEIGACHPAHHLPLVNVKSHDGDSTHEPDHESLVASGVIQIQESPNAGTLQCSQPPISEHSSDLSQPVHGDLQLSGGPLRADDSSPHLPTATTHSEVEPDRGSGAIEHLLLNNDLAFTNSSPSSSGGQAIQVSPSPGRVATPQPPGGEDSQPTRRIQTDPDAMPAASLSDASIDKPRNQLNQPATSDTPDEHNEAASAPTELFNSLPPNESPSSSKMEPFLAYPYPQSTPLSRGSSVRDVSPSSVLENVENQPQERTSLDLHSAHQVGYSIPGEYPIDHASSSDPTPISTRPWAFSVPSIERASPSSAARSEQGPDAGMPRSHMNQVQAKGLLSYMLPWIKNSVGGRSSHTPTRQSRVIPDPGPVFQTYDFQTSTPILKMPLKSPKDPVHSTVKVLLSPKHANRSTRIIDDITLESFQQARTAGLGGFGDLSVVEHEVGQLALKCLRQIEEGREHLIRRTLREGEVWLKLNHPAILPFFGAVEIDDEIYLVSPFMKKGSLQDYLGCNPTADRGLLLSQVISGIAYLHRQGIIHGGIKASNVLVSNDTPGRALLSDFGLSRDSADRTSKGLKSVGNLRYQSPEFLNGLSTQKSFQSDMWAYGMTMYEVLSGNIPYHDVKGLRDIVALIGAGLPPPMEPTSLGGVSYARLWELAKRCWEKDPQLRISSEEADRYLNPETTHQLASAGSSLPLVTGLLVGSAQTSSSAEKYD